MTIQEIVFLESLLIPKGDSLKFNFDGSNNEKHILVPMPKNHFFYFIDGVIISPGIL